MSNEYVHFNNNTQPAINEDNLNRMQQLIKQDINGAVAGDTLPIGAIVPYTGATAPTNWLTCDGSAISRTTYQDLFNVIGTTFGPGDGSTTFNLPDMRGRVPVGVDTTQTEFDTLGETGGTKTVTLTIDQIPPHDHNVTGGTVAGTGTAYAGGTGYSVPNPTSSISISNTGGGQAHNNLQPYQTTNYIIKAFQTAGVVAQVVNQRSTSTTDVYSADYSNNMLKVYPVTFSTGSIEPNADLYDKTKAITTNEISSDYTPIGIVGQSFVGGYYSHCFFSRLYVGGTNNRNIYWSIKNTSNTSIANLNCTIYVLAIKTTD